MIIVLSEYLNPSPSVEQNDEVQPPKYAALDTFRVDTYSSGVQNGDKRRGQLGLGVVLVCVKDTSECKG